MGSIAIAGSVFGSAKSAAAFQDGCMRLWARIVTGASFVRVTISGVERLDPTRSYVFCANHLSYMDPPVILSCWPARLRFVAKRSLFSIPFLGWGMRRGGHLAIDRERPRVAARDLETIRRQFGGSGTGGHTRQGSLFVFPEGGRSVDGELQPFLSGAFRLAVELQMPVVPVAVWGTREVLQPGSIHVRAGEVQITIGEPIEACGLGRPGVKELAAKAHESIRQMIAGRAGRGHSTTA
jgi:1-acyl-sn-glycerol-3-phosphate acyltransferase